MNYKYKIDSLRKTKKMILENLKLICDDLMFYDDKTNDLLIEHESYITLLNIINKDIKSAQPWYRKLTGLYY